MRKPRLFIGSSAESLSVAEAVNINLDHDFEITIWKNGTFNLSSSTIDDLVKKSSSVDFALFIFTPDDILTIRKKEERVVRDNVIFEMGLFVGSIGKSRSFILKPRGQEMHLPSDLLGVTPADYDPARSDRDLVSATNRACALIKTESERLGVIDYTVEKENRKIVVNPPDYELQTHDYLTLSTCLGSQTFSPDGMSENSIEKSLRGVDYPVMQLSLVKLERMGLISKTVVTDNQDGYEYYSFKITEYGIDTLIKNEDKLKREPEVNSSQDPYDEIPF